MHECHYVKTEYLEPGAVRIRLNRPNKHHALNVELLNALSNQLHKAFVDPDIQVIVMASSGKVFCAGADLAEMQSSPETLIQALMALISTLQSRTKPVVVELNGHVYGGGFLLLGLADIVVSAHSIQLTLPEVKSQLWPVMVMPVMKTLLPSGVLTHMALTGQPISAEEAHRYGWFRYLASPNQVEGTVLSIVDDIRAYASNAIQQAFIRTRMDLRPPLTESHLAELGSELLSLVVRRNRSDACIENDGQDQKTDQTT